MNKQTEALKLALEALEENHHLIEEYERPEYLAMYDRVISAVAKALAEESSGAEQPKLSDYEPDGMRHNKPHKCKYPKCDYPCPDLPDCRDAEQPAQQQKEGFASPGGGYVPAIPRPMPLDWKLVPRKATPEMLKAMDECAQEGYDERLYAGMASSVYMAAWDASPVMGTLPEQPAQQQEPVVWMYVNKSTHETKFQKHMRDFVDHGLWAEVPLYGEPLANQELNCVCGAVWQGDELVHLPRKPASKPWVGLTDEDLAGCDDEELKQARYWEAKLREKNA